MDDWRVKDQDGVLVMPPEYIPDRQIAAWWSSSNAFNSGIRAVTKGQRVWGGGPEGDLVPADVLPQLITVLLNGQVTMTVRRGHCIGGVETHLDVQCTVPHAAAKRCGVPVARSHLDDSQEGPVHVPCSPEEGLVRVAALLVSRLQPPARWTGKVHAVPSPPGLLHHAIDKSMEIACGTVCVDNVPRCKWKLVKQRGQKRSRHGQTEQQEGIVLGGAECNLVPCAPIVVISDSTSAAVSFGCLTQSSGCETASKAGCLAWTWLGLLLSWPNLWFLIARDRERRHLPPFVLCTTREGEQPKCWIRLMRDQSEREAVSPSGVQMTLPQPHAGTTKGQRKLIRQLWASIAHGA